MTSVMCQDEVRVSWHVTTRRLLYELPNQVKSYALTSLHTPDHFPNQTEWVLVKQPTNHRPPQPAARLVPAASNEKPSNSISG